MRAILQVKKSSPTHPSESLFVEQVVNKLLVALLLLPARVGLGGGGGGRLHAGRRHLHFRHDEDARRHRRRQLWVRRLRPGGGLGGGWWLGGGRLEGALQFALEPRAAAGGGLLRRALLNAQLGLAAPAAAPGLRCRPRPLQQSVPRELVDHLGAHVAAAVARPLLGTQTTAQVSQRRWCAWNHNWRQFLFCTPSLTVS